MNKFSQKQISIAVALIIAVFFLTAGAYRLGYDRGIENPKTVLISGVNNLESGKEHGVDFGLFWDAWQVIKDKYVSGDKLNNQDLVNGAISGLVGALKDPNSNFFPPSDAKKFNEDISGSFSGIGAEIGIRNDQLVIIAPLKDSPAEKAGLKASDKILEINGTSTAGISVDEAVKKIRGKKGTEIKLTILRNGWKDSKVIAIIRDTIQVPTLDFEVKEGGIFYVHLYNFYDQAPYLFYKSVLNAAFENPKGMILDLRNNPGGFLEVGINLAGWFLNSGEIVVKEEFRGGNEDVFKSQGPGILKDMPVVILINQGSASASEILAGALRDQRGIKIVGKKSFGKGTIQELETLKNDSLLKITIAHWLTPKGQIIEKNGIAPDYEVDLTDEDIEAGRDPQLEKAMEILKAEIKAADFAIPKFTPITITIN